MNDEDLQHPRRSAEESNFLADVFERADPQVAAFMARHNALLERVTVLERGLEQIANWKHYWDRGEVKGPISQFAQDVLDG